MCGWLSTTRGWNFSALRANGYTFGELRSAASIVAATVGVLICIHQHHVVLVLSEPSSYITVAQHRCGLVMLAGVLWFAGEAIHLGIRAAKSAQPVISSI